MNKEIFDEIVQDAVLKRLQNDVTLAILQVNKHKQIYDDSIKVYEEAKSNLDRYINGTS